jgi:hypothetical protein
MRRTPYTLVLPRRGLVNPPVSRSPPSTGSLARTRPWMAAWTPPRDTLMTPPGWRDSSAALCGTRGCKSCEGALSSRAVIRSTPPTAYIALRSSRNGFSRTWRTGVGI